MALDTKRFNKYLVGKGYATWTDATRNSVRLTSMIDMKKTTKEFNDNCKKIKKYYFLKSKGETSSFEYLQLQNDIIFC